MCCLFQTACVLGCFEGSALQVHLLLMVCQCFSFIDLSVIGVVNKSVCSVCQYFSFSSVFVCV